MVEDVSKRTLALLAVILIIVTIFGTWAVLNSDAQPSIRSEDQAKAIILLQIVGDAPASGQESMTGRIVLKVTD